MAMDGEERIVGEVGEGIGEGERLCKMKRKCGGEVRRRGR